MKSKTIIAALISIVMLLSTCAAQGNADIYNPEVMQKYSDMLLPLEDTAYMILGEKCEGRYCTFYDGIEQGVSDSNNPIYNEHITVEGIDARYFYKQNYCYIKVHNDYYEQNDKFFVQIMYYDFGPGVGYFHLEYYNKDGALKRISLEKSGKVQAWFTHSVYLDNADFSKCFENGANIRLVSNAFNAFKKLEIINATRQKRNGKAITLKYLPYDSRTLLETYGVLNKNDELYINENLSESVTAKYAWEIMQSIQCKSEKELPLPDEYKGKTALTQGELTSLYMCGLGIENSNDPIKAAYDNSFIDEQTLILQNDAPATRYNAIELARSTLDYKISYKMALLQKMFENNSDTEKITDKELWAQWYKQPRKIPKKQFNDNETGRTYYYMNIDGKTTMRPYATMQCWSSDGKHIIVGLASGPMFTYNIETEMLTYIDYCDTTLERMHAMMGTDDCIYYIKTIEDRQEIWKADINTLETQKIGAPPVGVEITGINISNDCNYIGVDASDTQRLYSDSTDALNMAARLCISTGEWKFFPKKWSFSNYLTHTQVNVGYPEILFYCHEISGGRPREIYDRAWILNTETSEQTNIFKQGTLYDGRALQQITHEVWSNTGDYLYIVIPDSGIEALVGKAPSVARIDKDGRHRQYFMDNNLTYITDHAYPSGDDRFIVFDGPMICLMSTETNQVIPLTRWEGFRYQAHPNQPHPVVARDHYVVSWGTTMDNVTSVMWMDFTNIAKNEFAKGGRYPTGKTVERVSYQGLDCESRETKYKRVDCYMAQTGKSLFFDIDESVVDSVDAKVKITFDYIDNGTQPLVIKYTSGVKSDNDYWRIYDNKKEVKRTGSGKWKHAEIIIESGNFENIGEYSTDIKIGGNLGATYIANINAERID